MFLVVLLKKLASFLFYIDFIHSELLGPDQSQTNPINLGPGQSRTDPIKLRPDQSLTDPIKLGIITPFDALQKKNSTNKKPITKLKQNTLKFHSNDASSGEEYIPGDQSSSSSDEDDVEVSDSVMSTQRKHKVNKLTGNGERRKKTVDDGDFNAFRERMRYYSIIK